MEERGGITLMDSRTNPEAIPVLSSTTGRSQRQCAQAEYPTKSQRGEEEEHIGKFHYYLVLSHSAREGGGKIPGFHVLECLRFPHHAKVSSSMTFDIFLDSSQTWQCAALFETSLL